MLCCMLWLCWNDEWLSELCVRQLVISDTATALIRRVLPQNGKTFMETRNIKDWVVLREALEDWMSGRQKGNFFKPLGSGPSESGRLYRGRESSYGRDSNVNGGSEREKVGSVGGYLTCFNCGERGHRSSECKKERKLGGSGYVSKSPTCFNCGKIGHQSTECTARRGAAPVKKEATPSKMSVLLNSKSGKSENVAYGLVNGIQTEVLIDSRAELGSVPRALVPKGVVLCNDVLVKGYGGSERKRKSFHVRICCEDNHR